MTEPAHKTAERAPAAKSSPAPAHAADVPSALLEQAPEVSAEGGGEPAARRAAILGDPRLLQRMGADQRAQLVRQLQRGQGNGVGEAPPVTYQGYEIMRRFSGRQKHLSKV